MRVVGIARDPTDAQLSQTIKLLFGTPAFARAHRNTAASSAIAVWLKGGPAERARLSARARAVRAALRQQGSLFDGVVPRRRRVGRPRGAGSRGRPRDRRAGRRSGRDRHDRADGAALPRAHGRRRTRPRRAGCPPDRSGGGAVRRRGPVPPVDAPGRRCRRLRGLAGVPRRRGADVGAVPRAARGLVRVRGRRNRMVPRRCRGHGRRRVARLGPPGPASSRPHPYLRRRRGPGVRARRHRCPLRALARRPPARIATRPRSWAW